MPSLPAVSVIIPNYNRESLIGRAIQSVLDQTFRDLELIIVDDGSTDQSAAFVKTIQDSRVTLVTHPVNLGLAAAWNTGIREARSGLIAFLDSDDSWHPDKLVEQISFLQNNPDVAGCTTGYIQSGLHRTRMVIPSQKDLELKQILFHNTLHLGTTMLIHREVFDKTGPFDEILIRGQDTDWLIRFVQTGNLCVIPKLLATVNQHTQRSAAILEQARIEMHNKYHQTYRRFGTLYAHKKVAKMWADVAYQYEREGNRLKMREYSLKSISSFPIQSPGIYLILVDALTGCKLKKTASHFRQFLFRAHHQD